jgi:hypothetical protein
MTSLHFTHLRKLSPGDPLDAVMQAQLEIVWRLKSRHDRNVPLKGGYAQVDEEYCVWDVLDEGVPRFCAWVSGAELVAFLHGTHTVVNYTIQSGLELDDEHGLSAREWTHDCTGKDCDGCYLPR